MKNLENSTIAIQKSGRLTKGTIDWLNEYAGTDFPSSDDPFDPRRELTDSKTGIKLLGYSNGDISKAIAYGQSDLGVFGSDKYLERPNGLKVAGKLGFGACMMVYAEFVDRTDLRARIATSYPRQAENYCLSRTWNACDIPRWSKYEIDTWSSGVEAIARRDGYTGVIDVVESGSSLLTNGLTVVDSLYVCEALLVEPCDEIPAPSEYDAMRPRSFMLFADDYLMLQRAKRLGKQPMFNQSTVFLGEK